MASHQRYLKVQKLIEDLETGNITRTSDWYDEQNDLIIHYADNLAPYSDLHQDIMEPHFRFKCSTLDKLTAQLTMEYSAHRWFSTYDYLRFNKLILEVADYVGDLNGGEDELCDLFDKFSCGKAN
jgi:hypothetical protein